MPIASFLKHWCIFFTFSAILITHHSSAKEPVLVVTELFDRFQYLDQNDELTGYSVAVVNELFALTGYEHQIDIDPWSVAFQKAKSQKNTMIFSMARNPQRENSFEWIGRLYQEPIYFWTLDKLNISPVTKLEQLKEYTIAVVRGANAHDYLQKHDFPNIYVMTSTFSNSDSFTRMEMLNGNRAHIVIASESDVVNAIKHIGLGRDALSKVFHDPELDNDLHVAFNISTDQRVLLEFRQAYNYLESSGRLARLRNIWDIE